MHYSDEELRRINSTSYFERQKIKYSFQDTNLEIKALAEKLREKMVRERLGLKDVALQTHLKLSEIDQFLRGADLKGKHSAIQQFLETTPPHILDDWEIFGEECGENVERCPICLVWTSKGSADHLCF
jgi:hypothetical protein